MSTAYEQWWNLVHRGGRLEELPPDECRDLARSKRVGRLAYQTERGLRIVPMNFLWHDDDAIYVRTELTSEAAVFSSGQLVAFEVDDVDDFLEGGWSVLVCGRARAQYVLPPKPLPEPWPEGPHPQVLRIDATQVTGRRLHPT